MLKALDNGKSVLVALEIPQTKESSVVGPHAVVVTNYKRKCCANVCVAKYQLLDSLGFYWAQNSSDGWVSEEVLLKALHPNKMSIILKKAQ